MPKTFIVMPAYNAAKTIEYIFRSIIYYPIFFAVIPLLSVYLRNTLFIPLSEFLTVALLTLSFLALMWLVIFRITSNLQKSALISVVFFILFFSFGQFLPGLANVAIKAGFDIHSQLYSNLGWKLQVILIVWIVLFLLLSYLIIKVKSDLRLITTFMNVTSIILFLLIISQHRSNILQFITNTQGVNSIDSNHSSIFNKDEVRQVNSPDTDYPNIYFIILDGYDRDDTLNNFFGYDNGELLSYLSNKGFYIATGSRSNYLKTFLSLSSTLNMQYLDAVADKMGTMSGNPIPILKLIKFNRVMDFLTHLGYTTVAFASGYHATELDNIDNYYSGTFNLSEFENTIINLTPLQIWLDSFQFETHRRRIRYTFDQLPNIVQSDQPTFIFAHILAPHEPFVFGPNGENKNPDYKFTLIHENFIIFQSENGYTDQVTFINSLVQNTVEKILSKPGKKPIIIIQGDHGSRSIIDLENMENSDLQTIFPIFNAYYFPDQDYSNLYPEISSVNTFRLILDQYFGTQMGMLEDRSYYSMVDRPYYYIDVTDQIENP